MALRVSHATTVVTPDSGDGKVSSNAWNAGHLLTGTAYAGVGFDADGAGIEIPTPKTPEMFDAVGDGTTDDAAALQAWLDSGGLQLLSNKSYRSSVSLIIRNTVCILGTGNGFDDFRSTAGGLTPASQIVFDAGVSGLEVQPQVTGTVIPPVSATQEGAYNSQIRDLALIGSGGATATGFYSRTLVHLTNVAAIGFSGKGFDIDASTVDPGPIDSNYGNASLSTLTRCTASTNGGHGFHLRGRDANVCKLDSCNSNNNGGWGYLDDSISGNAYVNCHDATNTLGSYKCVSAVAFSTYVGCYTEDGAPDLSYQCVVVGGMLSGACRLSNVGTNGHPQIAAPGGFEGKRYDVRVESEEVSLALSSGHGSVWLGGNLGLVLQGAPDGGGTYDVSILNKDGTLVCGVDTGGTTLKTKGIQLVSSNMVFNGATTVPTIDTSNAAAFSHVTGGLSVMGYGSSYDVSLLNRSGNYALRVPTSTTNVEVVGSLSIGGGTALTKAAAYAPSITPSSVAAATVAEQTFTVSGLTTADKVIVNPPSIANATGIAGARVSAADTLAIRFVNPTAGALTPASGTYTVLAFRS